MGGRRGSRRPSWSRGSGRPRIVALRRVQPAWVFAVVVVVYPIAYGATLQSEFHLLPVLVVGYTATSSGRVHPVVASIGCMAANLVLFWNHDLGVPGRALGDRPFDWPSVLFIELATVSVVVLGWLMHRQAEISRDLAQRNVELERLRAAEAQRVVAQERTRVARELHDVVAHHLTAVIIRAQAADRVRETRPEVASESIGWIAETAKEALTAMRGTVRMLRADGDAADLAPEPTLADLRSIAARVGEAGLEIELRMPEPPPDLEPQVELAAVRIAQEALTNAMRHAGARRAIVTLRCDADGVVVDVDDDGTSGPPSAAPTRRQRAGRHAGTGGGLRRPTRHRHQPARRLADPRVAPARGRRGPDPRRRGRRPGGDPHRPADDARARDRHHDRRRGGQRR